MEKKQICNKTGCGKEGVIETVALGWFCSEECRDEISTNFAKLTMGINPQTNKPLVPSQPNSEECCASCTKGGEREIYSCKKCKCHSPKPEENIAHDTEDGYCCACDYDIACMEDKISQSEQRVRKEMVEAIKEMLLPKIELHLLRMKHEPNIWKVDLALEDIKVKLDELIK